MAVEPTASCGQCCRSPEPPPTSSSSNPKEAWSPDSGVQRPETSSRYNALLLQPRVGATSSAGVCRRLLGATRPVCSAVRMLVLPTPSNPTTTARQRRFAGCASWRSSSWRCVWSQKGAKFACRRGDRSASSACSGGSSSLTKAAALLAVTAIAGSSSAAAANGGDNGANNSAPGIQPGLDLNVAGEQMATTSLD
eukprot:scaffold35280_cov62-Phaeocystis_antarctica.AAC.2